MKPPGLLTLFLLTVCLCINCQDKISDDMIDTRTVDRVDLQKYAGTWYEIARFPHSFEKDLVGVTATYTRMENGKIGVLNQGYKNDFNGKLKSARGKAKVPDPSQPGRLKVSFFLFFYFADYYILELDREKYQWAMIGSSSPNYFWILSRTPVLDENIYQSLLQKAEKRGYDLSRLQKVPQ